MPFKSRRAHLAYQRRYYATHPSRRANARRTAHRRNERNRGRIFEVLGPWCNVCGETDLAVLEVDHVAPVHAGHGLARGAARLYGDLLSGRETPFNLQVLCANDHLRKTRQERAQGHYHSDALSLAMPLKSRRARLAYMRRYYATHRGRIFEVLGPWCNVCGETDLAVLEVDHIAPVHAGRGLARGTARLYADLLSGRGTPFNLQVLCANDHLRKTRQERAQGHG